MTNQALDRRLAKLEKPAAHTDKLLIRGVEYDVDVFALMKEIDGRTRGLPNRSRPVRDG